MTRSSCSTSGYAKLWAGDSAGGGRGLAEGVRGAAGLAPRPNGPTTRCTRTSRRASRSSSRASRRPAATRRPRAACTSSRSSRGTHAGATCTRSSCTGSRSSASGTGSRPGASTTPPRRLAPARPGGAGRSSGRPLRQEPAGGRVLPSRPAHASLPTRGDGPLPPRAACSSGSPGTSPGSFAEGKRQLRLARTEEPDSPLGREAKRLLRRSRGRTRLLIADRTYGPKDGSFGL